MHIHEAVLAVENTQIPENLEQARNVLESALAKLQEHDYETKATYYYYLLRISLCRRVLFETEVEKHFYRRMEQCFGQQEKLYLQKYASTPNNSVLRAQIEAFYRLMERYFGALTITYARKEFREAEERSYLQKMRYRQNSYRFFGKWGKFGIYKLLEVTSLYGFSFFRWGWTCTTAIFLYAMCFFFVDGLQPSAGVEYHWYDALHFSIATFTTLGFGDIIPVTIVAKVIADIEVFTGYLMLGVFMALVQRKVF